MQGLSSGKHYTYNQQSSQIQFYNGSLIYLKDLFLYPSDPNFDELGSLEITDAFIDEANQVVEKAWNIVKSRIRFKLDDYCHVCASKERVNILEFDSNGMPVRWECKNGHTTEGLKPKMLGTCNPAKGWIYNKFYKPYKENTLPDGVQFIPALVTDNPNISKYYQENLQSLDHASKERLLYGNFEYDDDKAALISYDKIVDCFSNDFMPGGEKYITADIARFGSDSTVICIWDGLRCKIKQYRGKSVTEVAEIIKGLQSQYSIPNSNTVADEDGVGGGVIDVLKCKGFVNNSTPMFNHDGPVDYKGDKVRENFSNLKSQCYFKLAEIINGSGLYIDCKDITIRSLIIQELEQVKQYNMDKDGKKSVVPKDKVKEQIGRSPDFSDALMMRMYFLFSPKPAKLKFF